MICRIRYFDGCPIPLIIGTTSLTVLDIQVIARQSSLNLYPVSSLTAILLLGYYVFLAYLIWERCYIFNVNRRGIRDKLINATISHTIPLANNRIIPNFAIRRQVVRRAGKGTSLFRFGRQYEELPVLTFGLPFNFFKSFVVDVVPMYYLGIFFFGTQFYKNESVVAFVVFCVYNNPTIRSFCLLVLSVQVRIV